ncbi:flagellar basal body-associated FliL family protein [Marinobacterium rhizophilum]|uniref:Flagellar protein FliL n=1 Tax=Marinobacterium rhizophilum TaxID=420402 RepID=A0ABY5HD32_9GAMM|nr:flagellar basal body-associated FliL family protein [Marinobacterium rhizophilum]UTW10029.1 flagellar basal body-associated FliL family protein [Marinobacterium rhizophilum]
MAENKDGVVETAGRTAKSGPLMMVAVVLVALLVGGGGVAAFFMLTGSGDAQIEETAAPAVKAKALYTKIRTLEGQPMFIINLAPQSEGEPRHMLQIHVEAKSRDREVVDVLTLHMPRVVANLGEIFRAKHFESLKTHDGKLQLQSEALEALQNFMQEKIGRPGVEALLFTSFVMQ